jgi:hypothetical protein
MRGMLDRQGQAAVELVALLPLAVLLLALCAQCLLAGQAIWLAGGAARAAARAHALGLDAAAAAKRALPGRIGEGVHVRPEARGAISVAVPVPALVGRGRLATVHAHARFVPQRGG